MGDATIRGWLTEVGFDWERGRIIWQKPKSKKWPAYDPVAAEEIDRWATILDLVFDDGFGSPECPRFIAKDARAMYFPSQYDGSTSCVVVLLNLDAYLDPKVPSPYPGGS